MSTASLTARERAELCDLMRELGPDAPTLNEGWDVIDLAAHLVVRERDLWAAGGIMFGGPMRWLLERAMDRRRSQGLERLVEIIGAGEPVWTRVMPKGAQLSEYYIHHEDVRRANGLGPRTDRPDLDQKLARLVAGSAGMTLRRVPTGVAMVWDGNVIHEHGPEPRAVISGPPGDILLYLSGRRGAAQVELGGDPDSVAALAEAPLGI